MRRTQRLAVLSTIGALAVAFAVSTAAAQDPNSPKPAPGQVQNPPVETGTVDSGKAAPPTPPAAAAAPAPADTAMTSPYGPSKADSARAWNEKQKAAKEKGKKKNAQGEPLDSTKQNKP